MLQSVGGVNHGGSVGSWVCGALGLYGEGPRTREGAPPRGKGPWWPEGPNSERGPSGKQTTRVGPRGHWARGGLGEIFNLCPQRGMYASIPL